jgi:hypothetical protein
VSGILGCFIRYNSIVRGNETKMKVLVGTEKIPLKAKLIYDYVQKKSRYISIQVGIGGWKPMLATDDRYDMGQKH